MKKSVAGVTSVKWEVVRIRFFLDPATGQPHIYNHDVGEEEVEDVLREPGDDFPGRRKSRIALGQTEAGRYLQVVYVPDPEAGQRFRHYGIRTER